MNDWLSLLLRWAHFITGVAWIGASFYFNWLENHLKRRLDSEQQADPVAGDLWAVHGGGFYYLQKYRVAPERLPEPLHWFKYEAYFTWLTGFALLVVVYYWNAQLYLVAPGEDALSVPQAVGLGLASLLVSWLVYDGVCRSPLRSKPLLLAMVIFAWFSLLAVVLDSFFSGRATYIHVGAAIGTIMVANVFFVIIPAQKELVNALQENRVPDPASGQAALLRSLHNNYLTLPVLFIMISNHYPFSYASAWNLLILMVFSLAAIGIRHWFNIRHRPDHPRWILPMSILMLLGLMAATVPPRPAAKMNSPVENPLIADDASVMAIVQQRCTGCHAASPSLAGFTAPPLGILLENMQQLEAQAQRVFQVSVATRTMPLGNLTAMTEAERQLLAQWYAERQP